MSEIFSMTGEPGSMDVLRILGAVLVAVSGMLLGMAFQNEMRQRMWILQDLQRGILRLRQEIEYLKVPLEEASLHTGESLQEPMASFFTETGKKLGKLPGASFAAVWQEMEEQYLEDAPLKQEDCELIRQLGTALEQMEPGGGRVLLLFEQRAEAALEQACREYREKAQLYRRLGMMGGIFLVILFL